MIPNASADRVGGQSVYIPLAVYPGEIVQRGRSKCITDTLCKIHAEAEEKSEIPVSSATAVE